VDCRITSRGELFFKKASSVCEGLGTKFGGKGFERKKKRLADVFYERGAIRRRKVTPRQSGPHCPGGGKKVMGRVRGVGF